MKISARGCHAVARVTRLVPGDSDLDFRETRVLRSDGVILEKVKWIHADSRANHSSAFKRVGSIKPALLADVLANPERWVAAKVVQGWERA